MGMVDNVFWSVGNCDLVARSSRINEIWELLQEGKREVKQEQGRRKEALTTSLQDAHKILRSQGVIIASHGTKCRACSKDVSFKGVKYVPGYGSVCLSCVSGQTALIAQPA